MSTQIGTLKLNNRYGPTIKVDYDCGVVYLTVEDSALTFTIGFSGQDAYRLGEMLMKIGEP